MHAIADYCHYCAYLLRGGPRRRVTEDGGEEGVVHLRVVEPAEQEDDGLAQRLEGGVAHRLRQQVQPPGAGQKFSPAEEVEQELENKKTCALVHVQ